MSSKPSVLLVDDEEPIRTRLGPFLERAGFRVEIASDGEMALGRISREQFDLVVMDVLMPGLDGRETLRQMRVAGVSVPVILLTRVGAPAERAMALEEGADDYLNKPFDPQELVARIRAVLRRSGHGGLSLSSARHLIAGELTSRTTRHAAGRVTRSHRIAWQRPSSATAPRLTLRRENSGSDRHGSGCA